MDPRRDGPSGRTRRAVTERGQTLRIDVRFTPSALRARAGEVRIESDDPSEAETDVSLCDGRPCD